MIRKGWTWSCIAIAILIIVIPWIIIATQPRPTVYSLTRSLGLWKNDVEVGTWFISALFIFIAALLQFPFKQEEGWMCSCGYDVSFLQPESKNCPECGRPLQIEWTASHAQYSRKTLWRMRITVILFLLVGVLVCLGFVAKWINHVAGA